MSLFPDKAPKHLTAASNSNNKIKAAMATIGTSFLPHFTLPSRRNPRKQTDTSIRHLQRSRHRIHALGASIALPVNVDYLEREFSGHGVSFEGIGNSCVVKMGLQNGTVASLMLPSGLITSYKPLMWHGARTEVLHTTVLEGEDGEVVIQGGVSMDLSCIADGRLSWESNKWTLLDVRGSSEKYIQVELISSCPQEMEIKCLVTLQQDALGSEITVSNRSSSSLQMQGSVVSHLTVSTPDATYAVGLQGSNYHKMQPMASTFSIIPQASEEISSIQLLPQSGFDALFSRWGKKGQEQENEMTEEGEEEDDQVQMTEKMCRIYTNAPRGLTVMDRGRRNSVVVQRSGFDEFYIFSPGSNHEWYGKYAYICIGPAAVLKPVVLGPGDSWTGTQYLYNPNS